MPALISMSAALLAAIAQLIPVFPHSTLLLPIFLGQEIPQELQFSAVAGSACAGLVFFRHDWAAMLSGFLQVVLLRRRPLSLDERYPFLLTIAVGGALGLAGVGRRIEPLEAFYQANIGLALAIGLLLGALLLGYTDSNGKTVKTMTGWTVIDALLCAFWGGLALYFDGTLALGILIVGRLRGYYRDAAIKFLSLCSISLTWVHVFRFKSGVPWSALMPNAATPALQWILNFVVSVAATWIVLNAYSIRTEATSIRKMAVIRALAGGALLLWVFAFRR